MQSTLAKPTKMVSALFAFVVFGFMNPVDAGLVYSNDFDGNVQTSAGTTVNISGGTTSGGGITDSQGYDAKPFFGGDFWRITAPNDVLEFDLSNLPSHGSVSVCFSLAMMDSWDGTNTQYGPDIINVAILDGTTQIAGLSEAYFGGNAPSTGVDSIVVQNEQLGFNNGTQSWWNDDGYRMCFNDLTHSSGDLTLRFWASGAGFQGGNDESFAIDELMITATPEPTSVAYLLPTFLALLFRRKRR